LKRSITGVLYKEVVGQYNELTERTVWIINKEGLRKEFRIGLIASLSREGDKKKE